MKVYVVSKSADPRFALRPDNLLFAQAVGANPQYDALEFGRDLTELTGEENSVHEVHIRSLGTHKVKTEVFFDQL